MKTLFIKLIIIIYIAAITSCGFAQKNNTMISKNTVYSKKDTTKIKLDNNEWKKILSPEVYEIARNKGTERPFTGSYWNTFDVGTYRCKACGNALFKSNGKFESSCGWPSFFESISKESIIYKEDNSYGMERVEVMCGRCEAHLGHVFNDGPPPAHKRYCINGTVIELDTENK